MFWIPICFLWLIIWLVSKGVNTAGMYMNGPARTVPIEKVYAARTRFIHQTDLSEQERVEISKTASGCKMIEFMGDGDDDWNHFYFSTYTAYMIEAAKRGKLWENGGPLGYSIGSIYSDYYVPAHKPLELTEKFLLKIEDELRAHGVDAVIMADYRQYYFSPVRSHVAQWGYGQYAEQHMYRGSLRFCWAPFTTQWEGKAPDF